MEIFRNPNLTEYINDLDLVISDSGYARLDNSWNCSNVCSPYSRIYFIKNGTGFLLHGDKHIPLRPDNVYLIPANLDFSYECSSFLDQLYFHINIFSTNGHDLLDQIKEILMLNLNNGEIDHLTELYGSSKICCAFKLQQCLQKVVAEFIQKSAMSGREIIPYSEFLSRLYSVIAANLSVKTTQTDIARKMSVAPRTLAKKFKEETGITLGVFVK